MKSTFFCHEELSYLEYFMIKMSFKNTTSTTPAALLAPEKSPIFG